METAGRAVAIAIRHVQPQGSIAILCGSGGNGGDGLVCARYLAGWGYDVQCWLTKPAAELHGLAAHQLRICQKLGIPIVEPDERNRFRRCRPASSTPSSALGSSTRPSGRAAQLIEAANRATAPILAIDIPSGVDSTWEPRMSRRSLPDLTLTLGLPKQGLLIGDGPAHAGTVVVADIGIPAAAYASVGIPLTSDFRSAELVTLDGRPWPNLAARRVDSRQLRVDVGGKADIRDRQAVVAAFWHVVDHRVGLGLDRM